MGGRSERVGKKNRCRYIGIAKEWVSEMNTMWLILLTGIMLINIIANFAVKFNDLKHVEIEIRKIWEELKILREETVGQGERVSHIEGRLNGK